MASVCVAIQARSAQTPQHFPSPFSAVADQSALAAQIQLGARLFSEVRLSVSGQHSCASCHDPARAYTDGRPRSVGALGEELKRNSPSIVYSGWNRSLGWDPPGHGTLETQMRVPLFSMSPVEMGLSGREATVIEMLKGEAAYVREFREAFPDDAQAIRIENLVAAIANFVRSLPRADSAFDRYLWQGEKTALSPAARRGMDLFFSERLGCSQCHRGVTFQGSGTVSMEDRFADNGYRPKALQPEAQGAFKPARIPSLRNVAVTAPYMRDGELPDLITVLDHYAAGSKLTRPARPPLHLSQQEKAELVSFLCSLTDRAWADQARTEVASANRC